MSARASFTEYDWEPVPGLPGPLPPAESLLWQGKPQWRKLAVRAFHVRKIAVYMALALTWRIADGVLAGEAIGGIAFSMLWLVPMAIAAVAIPALMAWAYARSTVYSITTRRLVVRAGVALPMAVNVPFKLIESAGALIHSDGTGDIPVRLVRAHRVSWLQLWPHLRPWRFTRPEPMIRCVAEGAEVARILATALQEAAESTPAGEVQVVHRPAGTATAPARDRSPAPSMVA